MEHAVPNLKADMNQRARLENSQYLTPPPHAYTHIMSSSDQIYSPNCSFDLDSVPLWKPNDLTDPYPLRTAFVQSIPTWEYAQAKEVGFVICMEFEARNVILQIVEGYEMDHITNFRVAGECGTKNIDLQICDRPKFAPSPTVSIGYHEEIWSYDDVRKFDLKTSCLGPGPVLPIKFTISEERLPGKSLQEHFKVFFYNKNTHINYINTCDKVTDILQRELEKNALCLDRGYGAPIIQQGNKPFCNSFFAVLTPIYNGDYSDSEEDNDDKDEDEESEVISEERQRRFQEEEGKDDDIDCAEKPDVRLSKKDAAFVHSVGEDVKEDS